MNSGEKQSKINIYIVLNPVAGNSTADDIRSLIEENFPQELYTIDIYETTGKEDVAQLTRQACEQGANLVIAAGGDGTVAGVVNGLANTKTPLGILPVGTGNGLARALNIPLDVEEAAEMIAGDHGVMTIDAMKVGEEHYLLNAGAGIAARAMQRTPADVKRRFGIFAYLWSIISEAMGFTPQRFELRVDGKQMRVRASEILISNSTLLEKKPRPLGTPADFTDGMFDVYVIGANTLFNYLKMIGQLVVRKPRHAAYVHHLAARHSVEIEALGKPQPTQGDGEVIGQTPLKVEVVPQAVSVIVPCKSVEEPEK